MLRMMGTIFCCLIQGDVDKLAEQMERMIADPMLRDKIARASVHLADTIFNLQTINGQIENLYNDLLS